MVLDGHWSIFAFYLINIAVITKVASTADPHCPINCECEWSTSNRVNCSAAGVNDASFEQISHRTEYLDLSHNELPKLPEPLSQYENLITLNLSSNKIISIHRQAFNRMHKLKTLDLSDNRIKDLSQLLIGNSKLESLDLSGNPLTSLGEDYDQILYSESLLRLDVSRSSITHVQGAVVFRGLPKLTHLNLARNPIQQLEGFISDSLTSLDVSGCKVQFLRPDSFDGVRRLRELRMSRNKRLDGQDSKLSSKSIVHLDVSYCSIDSNYASNLPNVHTVLLKGNSITELEANAFQNNSKLELLDLSDNRIQHIHEMSFYGTESLQFLDLSGNLIASLAENTLTFASSLLYLNLSRNFFSTFGLLKAQSLISLDISSCKIDSLSARALIGLPSLQVLNISYNNLKMLPDNLTGLSLQLLDVSYCRLTSINALNFHRLQTLKEINMSGNRLVYIRNSTFADNKLTTLILSNNPWRCDCLDENFRSLWAYLTEPPRVKNISTLICQHPDNVTGLSWQEACSADWNSGSRRPKDILVLMIIVVVLFVSGVTACIVALRESCVVRESGSGLTENDETERGRSVRVQRIDPENEGTIRESIRKFTQLPSYDEALLLPRPASSSGDAEASTDRAEKSKKRQSATQTDESISALLQELGVEESEDQDGELMIGEVKRRSWQEIEYINIAPLRSPAPPPRTAARGVVQCTEL